MSDRIFGEEELFGRHAKIRQCYAILRCAHNNHIDSDGSYKLLPAVLKCKCKGHGRGLGNVMDKVVLDIDEANP
jgi:hypothetical protein